MKGLKLNFTIQEIKSALMDDISFTDFINGRTSQCWHCIEVDNMTFLVFYTLQGDYQVYISSISICNLNGRDSELSLFASRLLKAVIECKSKK